MVDPKYTEQVTGAAKAIGLGMTDEAYLRGLAKIECGTIIRASAYGTQIFIAVATDPHAKDFVIGSLLTACYLLNTPLQEIDALGQGNVTWAAVRECLFGFGGG